MPSKPQSSDVVDIFKAMDRVEKKIKLIMPNAQGVKTSPMIHSSGLYKGKRWNFKYPPKTVLQIADEYMQYRFLSDNQKNALVEIFGTNPEEWNLSYQEVIMLIGQGGGKNTWIEVASGYALQYLINLANPYDTFSTLCKKQIPQTSDFEFTNNSMVGESQARTVFFDRIKKVIRAMKEPDTGENIFQKYAGIDLRDEGLGDIKSKVIEFPPFFPDSGRIKLHSLDSGIATFEGKTIFMAFMDEPSRAVTEATYNSAKILYKGLAGNLNTRFPNCAGKLFAFSYPNTSEYDLTYELATGNDLEKDEEEKKKKKENKIRKIYIYSTFEFNPSVKRTDPQIIQAYEDDPDDAKARYECIKTRSKFAFFQPHVEKVLECVIKGLHNRVSYNMSPSETIIQGKRINRMAVYINEIKGDNKYRSWAMDASKKKDRFVICSGYSEALEQSYNNYIEPNIILPSHKRVIVDLIIVWQPTKNLPVDYKNVSDVIELLLEAFPNSVSFKADQWQAESIATIFESRGIKTNLIQFLNTNQMKLYSQFRTALFNNLVGYIEQNLLIEELQRVQKINDNKVDHPKGFSKDVADAVVLLYNELSSLEYDNIGDVSNLDRFRDKQLIETINKFIVAQNEARQKNISDIEAYVCEKLNIPQQEYNKIIMLKEIYFPNPI